MNAIKFAFTKWLQSIPEGELLERHRRRNRVAVVDS